MDSDSGDVLEHSGTACALQPSSLQQSNLQLPTHSDQLQEVLKHAEDVATQKIFPTDDETIHFTISRESWLELREDPNFDRCIEYKAFRASFDSSRSLVTITGPASERHHAIVRLLADVAHVTLVDKTPIRWYPVISHRFTGEYEDSLRQPDFSISWDESLFYERVHTVVEIGVSQSLEELRALIPLHMKGNPETQRVILIKLAETPKFQCPESIDIDIAQEFRRDRATGVIWFGNAKVIGETRISWELWERDAAGVPQSTFHETFAFGEMPSRNLPFLTISEGIYGDTEIRGEVNASITPQMIQQLWRENWPLASWGDASVRLFDLIGESRLREAMREARDKGLADELNVLC
ncbi:hypothetical protein AYL99_11687 [Fonsecaea erecta]|uniref:Uncharacterized protein n=1 Tax=Fonsecaea erecta TaxID=1367422 RepID=A0A178Z301_9EURO|nr:hypothetical protein AYL99_11687 [Fonsecaea erecta]OAP54152.1 hypothetical protein AYL99_11687 [Fonsecaea erecta]